MATAETPKPADLDIVRRAVVRSLPCKLTDDEFMRIAKTRVGKETERDQLVADAKLDADKRKAQIKEYDDEIVQMRREMHTGYQDRAIKTNEVFRKDEAGNCWIYVVRLDNGDDTGERWPASPSEMQRYLPASDGSPGGLLEQAANAQAARSAQDAPPDSNGEDVPQDDAGEAENDAGDEADGETGKPKRGKKGK